jgi:hypothetical protein
MLSLNGLHIYRTKDGRSRFIALPRELWRSAGKCACPYCQGKEGSWDTLAVGSDGGFTFTVHFPALHNTHLPGVWSKLRDAGIVPNDEAQR